MKKLLFLLLLATSCKKETTPQPTTPTPSTTLGVNYAVLNGDLHINDTIRFLHTLVGNDSYITGSDTNTAGCYIWIYPDTIFIGTHHISAQNGNNTNIHTSTTSNFYWFPEMDITFTRIDNIIEGTYSGDLVSSFNNSVHIQINGKFSVTRQ